MKKLFKTGLLILTLVVTTVSCTNVDTGHEAAIVSYGGQTDMSKTLPEGIHWGLNYLVDDAVPYVVREQTYNYEITLNDKNDMATPVSVVVYYQAQKGRVNKVHSLVGPDYKDEKLKAFIASVVEQKLTRLLAQEAAAIYVSVPRVNFTKVGIPTEVARIAEETAVQLSRNELATKKEAEQVALAKAKVAEAQGNYDAGVLNAKTQELLSQPKMMERQRIENEKIMWQGYYKHGKSPFGENNIFGGANGANPFLMLQK